MQVLGWPVRGAHTWTEELAWLVAHGGTAEARWRVEAARLDVEAAALADEERQAQAALQRAQAELKSARVALDARAGEAPPAWPAWLLGLAALGGVAVIVAASAGGDTRVVLFIAFGAALAVGLGKLRAHAEVTHHEQRSMDERQALERAEAAQAQRAAALNTLRARAAESARRRDALAEPPRLRAVGRVHLALDSVGVGGQCLLLDRSQTAPERELRVPDLGAEPQTLDTIRAALEAARAEPVVLDGDAQAGEIGCLHGQERQLHAAVEAFAGMVERSPVVAFQLRLVARHGALARLAASTVAAGLSGQRLPGPVWHDGDTGISDEAARLTAAAERLAQTGGDVDSLLRDLQQGLESTLSIYAGLRGDALAKLHAAVDQVIQPSSLLHVTWYCPKCNRVPAYLFHKLGVELEVAHRGDPLALVDRLEADEDVRRRLLEHDERLKHEIFETRRALVEIEASVGEWRERRRGQAAEAPIEAHGHEAHLRALAAQHRELVEHFRACLRRAVSGDARPLVELSAQARLHLDPQTRAWTCAVCSTAFDEEHVAPMGRMLRIKEQLLMPMWNHLWTEKDDFRKSELFRTNEQLQRLVEKEVAALRDTAEQYRADMRPVRENLILALTDAQSKRQQLDATVSSLAAVGLADPEAPGVATARIEQVTGGDLVSYRQRAEAKETLLEREPQAQMLRRLPAADPITMFLTPEALFREHTDTPMHLRTDPHAKVRP